MIINLNINLSEILTGNDKVKFLSNLLFFFIYIFFINTLIFILICKIFKFIFKLNKKVKEI